MAQEYIPGVCNIGPEEITRRRNLGWSSLGVAVVLTALLVWTGVNQWWRLFVFFPATLSASGFLQAYFQFCSGFARRGIFNFDILGRTQSITDETSKSKDQKQGNRITLYAVLIGIIATLVIVFI